MEFNEMSEELIQKGLTEHGLIIGNYELYNIGNTTLNQLKKYKIIPNRQYKEYGTRKPDVVLVDRRNKKNIRVILVIEHKDVGNFRSESDKLYTIQQCNDLCQVLKSDLGVATDGTSFIWFNPNQKNKENEYLDRTSGKKRSYTIIISEDGTDFIKDFSIDQREDEVDIGKLNTKTISTLQNIDLLLKCISSKNSQIIKEKTIDPTALAKQIWQDVWSVSGATPEKCLYTFIELFIFKYLSDLKILIEDDKGNNINFNYIYSLSHEKAFINYSSNVRPYLKVMFPKDKEDGTTIINGTVLNPKVPEHSKVFYKILKKFNDFGELKNIDPHFKSKVFEEFMKESISKKNWGQFFTPRNIINSIIEISDIDQLEENSVICDPACGVGGFILEPMKVKDDGVNFYYRIEGNEIKPRHIFCGFDKGFEKEEQLTIILAKANMLIFLSELVKKNPTMSDKFSKLFNSSFKLLSKTILGTLSRLDVDKYDLIITNPPYVTSGSSNYKEAIKNDGALKEFYKINAMGVEGLFLEWIVRCLKPSKKAFVIIPDGILNRSNGNNLRKFIKDQCIIDGIISLPTNAFYTTPKKTYILAITKKSGRTETERKQQKQNEPVFTYLVSNTGETLDVKRFVIPDNDLVEMVSLFNQFKGAKNSFVSIAPRCKIQPIEHFNPDNHWSVDRWWSRTEKIELGIKKKDTVLTLDEFKEKFSETLFTANELCDELNEITVHNKPETFAEIQLNDVRYFEIFIGKRVLKKDVFNSNGNIPVYSANVFTPFGYLDRSNIQDFLSNYILWGIDGDFEFNIIQKDTKFATTDHCGTIKVIDDKIIPEYLLYELRLKSKLLDFDRTLRPSLANMELVSVEIPIDMNGDFDVDKQIEISQIYNQLCEIKEVISKKFDELNNTSIEI